MQMHTHNISGDVNKLSKCHELLTSIGDALSPSNLDHLQQILPYVTNMLENTHHAVMSAMSNNSTELPLIPFEPSFKVGPGQKHEKQLCSLHPTTQKSGRKRQNILK